jgi:chromosome segregation ATPase
MLPFKSFMRRLLFFLLPLLEASALAADPPNPAEARLREALKQLTARVQTAESEAATLRATQADAEAKNKALTAERDKLRQEAAAAETAAKKALATAETKLTAREAELTRAQETLEKWKTAHAQVTELGKKAEAGRLALAAKVPVLEQRVADLTRKNLALYKLGSEILQRLQDFSYGKALAAREPFIGTTRVKLENQVQGYQDQLLDPKLKP